VLEDDSCMSMSAMILGEVERRLPEQIRVSLGSAVVIGLAEGKLDAKPSTAYLMTYRENKCAANCGFCPQARGSRSNADMLSRVSWPVFPTEQVINGLREAVNSMLVKRVCVQALNYPEVFSHLQSLVKVIYQEMKVPLSISCQPLNRENIKSLAEAGAERIGIPLDATTPELFYRIKGVLAGGPYSWEKQFELLRIAVSIFGKGKVSTHLIVGLGETEEEMVKAIQQCVDMDVLPALFAFTPIQGTPLETWRQPSIQSYRQIQTARHIILLKIARSDDMLFDSEGHLVEFGVEKKILEQLIQNGLPFQTSGCPDCNRPYYNEKPSGPIYNYPRPLTRKELSKTREELSLPEA